MKLRLMPKTIVVERADGTLRWLYRDEIHDVGTEGKECFPFVDIRHASGIVARMRLSREENPVYIYDFWTDGEIR